MQRLDDKAIEEVVVQIAVDLYMACSTVSHINQRSDGIPLFAEELVKALLPTQSRNKENPIDSSDSNGSEQIPASLHDSLMARLDQMPAAKSVAQMAACIGREFNFRDLIALTPESNEVLTASLLRLQAAEILNKDPKTDDEQYLFRHALLRDAAYESLPRSRRERIHSALFDRLLERAASSSDLLAHHALEAKQYDDAALHPDEAGTEAAGSAAFDEAYDHFEKAIFCTQLMDDTIEARKLELDILVHQRHASTALNKLAHPTTANINIQTRRLLDCVADSPYEWAAQFGVDLMVPVRTYGALASACQGTATRALQLLADLEVSVHKQAHPGTMIYAFSHLALVSQVGHLPSRQHYFSIATQLAEEHGLRAYQGHTIGIKAMYLLDMGKFNECVDCMEKALSIINQSKTYIYTPLLYSN